MSKQNGLFQALLLAEQNGGTVTYHFENGVQQISNINKEIFTNEKGRRRDLSDVADILRDNMYDIGATSFMV